jgi:hypothetical protein
MDPVAGSSLLASAQLLHILGSYIILTISMKSFLYKSWQLFNGVVKIPPLHGINPNVITNQRFLGRVSWYQRVEVQTTDFKLCYDPEQVL